MKVLLINPKETVWSGGTSSIPLGLAYLASSLKQDDHEIRCIDMHVEQNINLSDEIRKCDIVGISACTSTVKPAWGIAAVAKGLNKTVILGGPHPTILPEESIEKGNADIVVRGEGEETIRDICAGKILENIPGITFRKKGETINTPDRPLIKDIDTIPFPDRGLFKLNGYKSQFHKKNAVTTIFTSRGCPCLCNFCCRITFGTTYRMRTPENVISEWQNILNSGIEEIHINDDNFSAVPSRAIEICRLIIEKGLVIPWTASGGLRVDRVSKELLEIMKKSGCYRVSLGAESGSQNILDVVGKKISLQQIKSAVKMCKETGIETLVFFMIGNLGESEKTMQSTIDFAKELDPDFAQFTIAVPYPGTDLYDYVKKNGKMLVTEWEEFGSYTGKAYFECETVTKDLIESMFKKAYRSYYMRPKIALKLLSKYKFRILKGFSLIK
ncbi:MAG: radical SAM protein [Elusimicrobiota bacterium]